MRKYAHFSAVKAVSNGNNYSEELLTLHHFLSLAEDYMPLSTITFSQAKVIQHTTGQNPEMEQLAKLKNTLDFLLF